MKHVAIAALAAYFRRKRMRSATDIHPVFRKFPAWKGLIPANFVAYYSGSLTDSAFLDWPIGAIDTDQEGVGQWVGINEETFEWIAIFEAILESKDTFTMMELGAGFGRWLMNAACAVRNTGKKLRMIAVEGEPTHYDWLHQHFRTNGFDPAEHQLLKGVVSDHDGTALFGVDDAPSSWYGQYILSKSETAGQHTQVLEVPSYSLSTLLARLDYVDLIDCDIQGAEDIVFPAAMKAVTEKVKRVFIGTHGPEIENTVRAAFRSHGWKAVYDFGCLAERDTPIGNVKFGDGVQYWLNTRLRR